MTSRLRILLAVMVCTVLPLLATSGIAYWAARSSLQHEIISELQKSSYRKLRQFQIRLAEVVVNLNTWSGEHVMQDVLVDDQNHDISRELTRLLALYPMLDNLRVANASDAVIASVKDRPEDKSMLGGLIDITNTGKTFQSAVMDQGADRLAALTIAVPIRADYDQNTVIGALVATLSWKHFTAFLGATTILGEAQNRDHNILLTDRAGRVLFGDAATAENLQRYPQAATLHGRAALVGIARSETLAGLQNPNWTLRQIVSTEMAFGSVNQTGRYMILASLAVTLLAMLTGLFTLDRVFAGRKSREAERLKALANAAVEGLVVCDKGRIVDANDSFLALMGVAPADVIGHPLEDFATERCRTALANGLASDGKIVLAAELQPLAGDAIAVEIVRRERKGTAGGMVVAVRDLSERTLAEAQIQHLAHHDGLTSLANRSFFLMRLTEEIARAKRAGKRVALHYMDLDRFKEINDTFGHAGGDALLIASASRLEALTRDGGIVGRMGGDEFVLLQIDIEHADEAIAVAERICKVLGAPVTFGAGELSTTASLGFAVCPEDGDNAGALMNAADLALYRAKEDGRATFRAFETSMAERARERRALQADLQDAVDADSLQVVFQPQYGIQSGKLVGFEALVRWTHPEKGVIPPTTFIPLAEESGIIHQLGAMVLRVACREASRWEHGVKVAVNLSPCQIIQGDLPRLVHEVLFETGLPASRLELEITEGVLIRDTERALHVLRQIKALGVRIAMDDFGTGYSSLSYLQSFPFDVIKIDRSFIQNLETSEQSRAIVRTMIGLGRGLGLSVVAEGVESESQLAFVREQNCDEVQGYLTGRPQPIDTFDPLLFLNRSEAVQGLSAQVA